MSNENLDYTVEHYCPVYKKIISPDVCYESLSCLNGGFHPSSYSELDAIDIPNARTLCAECPYSEL